MAALLPVPGVARVVCTGLIGGVKTANVFHIRRTDTSPFSQTELDNTTTAVGSKFGTRFVPLCTALFTFTGAQGIDLTSPVGVVSNYTASIAGSLSTSGVNAATAQCISWRTSYHFRGGHCRTYLPPPAGTDVTGGNTWAGATASTLQTAANGFITDMRAIAGVTSSALVMVTRTHEKAQRNPPIWFEITSAIVDSRVDTMRRRLGKDR